MAYVTPLWVCICLSLDAATNDLIQPRFDRYIRDDALFYGTVLHIHQNIDAHMWFAGRDGIVRYDGLERVRFALPQSDNSGIQGMAGDNQGSLVVTSRSGQAYHYNPLDQRFEPISQREVLGSLRALPSHGSKILLVNELGALYQYHSSGNHKLLGLVDALQVNNKIHDAHVSIDQILVATENGAFIIDTRDQTLSVHKLNREITFSATLWNNKAIFGGKDGLTQIPLGTAQGGRRTHDIENVYALAVDHDNQLWLGTYEHGLFLLRSPESKEQQFINDKLDVLSLPNNNVLDLYLDGFNNLWISTDSGVARYSSTANRWNHIRQSSRNGLVGESIGRLAEDRKQRLWVGTHNDGISIFDNLGGRAKNIQIKRERKNAFKGNSADVNSAIYRIYAHSDGSMWVGHSDGIHTIDEHSLTPAKLNLGNINMAYVFAISEAHESTWVGTYRKGVLKMSPTGNKQYRREEADTHGLASNTIYEIFRDKTGELWFLTASGLYFYDNDQTHFTNVSSIVDDDSVADLEMNTMQQRNSSEFWLGTAGHGIIIFDIHQKAIIGRITVPQLQSNYINGIQFFGNTAYVSTNEGFYRINLNSYEVETFGFTDGLQGEEFNSNATLKRASGALVFGGMYGFNHFYPDRIIQKSAHAMPYLEIFSRNQTPLYRGTGNAVSAEPIPISHREFPLTFHLKSLHYGNASLNNVRFRIGQSDWHQAGQNFQLSMQHLPRNRNDIVVEASDWRGQWSEKTAFVPLQVSPAPWDTVYAYVLYCVVLVGFILLIYHIRIRAISARAERLEQQVAERTEEIAQQKTEIQNQYAQLEKLTNEKTQFFENLSHEFRTPLTLILGPVRALLAKSKTPAPNSSLAIIERNALRLKHLIEQLLEISRVSSGLKGISPTTINLYLYIEEMLHEFGEIAQSSRVTLINHIPPNTLIHFDMESLEHILFNLTSNAIKYNRVDGTVRFYVTEDSERHITLHIEDSGNGISPEMIPRVFDRFARLENNHQIAGTGIGLALVHELIRLNKSAIQVESDGVTGSKFSFSVGTPTSSILQPEASIAPCSHRPSYISSHTGIQEEKNRKDTPVIAGKHALVIDDDADMRTFLQQSLSEYSCVLANSGDEGLPIAIEHVPDVIITDAMMPGMDGFELTEHLKEHPVTSHIPVIILTARGSRYGKIEGLKTGADDYLVKPFDPLELCQRIDNLLSNRRRIQEKHASSLGQLNTLPSIVDKESIFRNKLDRILLQHYQDPEFGVTILAKHMAMSERQLQRKLKAVVGCSPNEAIRTIRLRQAKQRIENGASVSEACFGVGFSSLSHFSREFKQVFQVSPSKINQ